MANSRNRHALIYVAAGIVLAALALRCGALPQFAPIASEEQPVRIQSGHQKLSAAQSKAILDRLREQGKSDVLDRHLAFMETVSDLPLTLGNEAHLLIDGPATYEAMFRAIGAARDHINLETYILRSDELGNELARRLIAQRGRGVTVNVLYDSVGSLQTSKEFFADLESAGIALCEFNPINPIEGRGVNVNHRDHRKILIVDGAIAFTGGINFDSVYDSSGSSIRRRESRSAKEPNEETHWRDTQIEIRGPAAAQFQRLFLETWRKQKCSGPEARSYFPPLKPQGNKIVRVIGSSPDDRESLIYLALLSAITRAERSVDLTMAYFVPDRQMLDAVTGAARRGVQVRIIMPGFSDSETVLRAGRSYYSALLRAGVRIYERHDVMLHAKTAVIDGVWSTVGSANMDMRSFLHNDEVNAEVLGAEFGREMTAMFERDLSTATPIELEQWESRPFTSRVKEWFARLWQYWI